MDDDTDAPGRADPVVVAGIGPCALLVTVAALRAGHGVVGIVERPDQLRALMADQAVDGAAELTAALDAGRYQLVEDPQVVAGFSVGLVTEPLESDAALSAVELYTAALAPRLHRGGLLVVSSPTAEHAGVVAAATVELLTGLQAGTDYALGHLFPPAPRSRLIVSGVDAASSARTQEWLAGLGFGVMPVMPVAAAEVVATLLARAGRPPDEPGTPPH